MAGRAACLTLLLIGTASAVPHETIRHPEGYSKVAKVAPGTPLKFQFALKHTQEALTWLRDTVGAVSNPDSTRYGAYVALDVIHKRMAVPAAQVTTVRESLEAAGFEGVSLHIGGDFIAAQASARVASDYFRTDFCAWEHATHPAMNTVRACELTYDLPGAVSPLVDFVAGLVHFPKGPSLRVDAYGRQAQHRHSPLDTLRSTYNMSAVKPTGKSNSSVAYTQFIGELYSPSSLQFFEKTYSPEQVGQKIAKVVGPPKTGSGTAALIDSQYLLGVSRGIDVWVWTNPHLNPVNNQEPWAEFFTNVAESTTVPNLFSISYGEGENTLTLPYMDRSDVELQKIAARGITVAVGSGNDGSGCSDDPAKRRGEKFVANFPGVLPHVLAVGATNDCGKGSEVDGFSSGGFSNTFPRQAWQEDAVAAFLSSGKLPPASAFNRTGRAYPDVSACGNVVICAYESRCGVPAGGTSASAPIFAGVLGLLNDVRMSAGKPPLGFVAPALYKAYAADPSNFNDVTNGTTYGCGKHHWTAGPGWDPTSGLGTPNFGKLAKTLLSF